MIQQSKAIVLKKINYGNSSLICNLFTQNYGKINIIAKGAKNIKNPSSGILQPLNFINIIYYYKNQRNIQTLKEVSLLKKNFCIDTSYEKIMRSLTIVEVLNKLSFEDSPCEIIFRLTTKTLDAINLCSEKLIDLYYAFYLGYQPNFCNCNICGGNIKNATFHSSIGQIVCENCSLDSKVKLNAEHLNIIKIIMNTHIDKLNFTFNGKDLNTINNLLFKFSIFHLPELKNSNLFNNAGKI